MDSYYIYGRLFPAILSYLPLLVLYIYLPDFHEFVDSAIKMKLVEGVTLNIVLLFFYAMLIRRIAKIFEDNYFGIEKEGMPTTYLMLFKNKDEFSDDFKINFRSKIKKDFSIELLSQIQEDEDPKKAKQLLNEAVSQVRLKIPKGQLVFKHNIWYGFYRNLSGGTIVAALISMINIILGLTVIKSHLFLIISSILFFFYTLYFLFNKFFITKSGEEYAKVLLNEYMAS